MRVLAFALCAAAIASAARADDPLADARTLYSAAAYEEALQSLNQIPKTPEMAEQVDQYRVFCLAALGREQDARSLAEQILTKHPLLQVLPDASPRLVALFTAARREVLPPKIRETYRAAVAAVEQRDYAAAEPQLNMVKRLLDAADAIGPADTSRHDMRLLVDGFLSLGRMEARSAGADESAARAPDRKPDTIYSSDSRNVSSPVALRQVVPPLPPEIARRIGVRRLGVLELLIDERGRVEHVTVQRSIHPAYDALLKERAAEWTYRPALVGSTPVKFRKIIELVVEPQ